VLTKRKNTELLVKEKIMMGQSDTGRHREERKELAGNQKLKIVGRYKRQETSIH
jgi:hypothetical protein